MWWALKSRTYCWNGIKCCFSSSSTFPCMISVMSITAMTQIHTRFCQVAEEYRELCPIRTEAPTGEGVIFLRGDKTKKQTITIFHLHIRPSLKGLKGSSKQLSISVSTLKPEMPTLRGQLQHLFPSSEPTVPVTGLCCFLHWLDLSYLPPQRAAGVHRYASSHLSAPYAPPSQSDTPNWFSVWSSQNCLNPRKYLK